MEELRWLTDVYMQVQKVRISSGNRAWAAKNKRDSNQPHPLLLRIAPQLQEVEEIVSKEMREVVREHPVWEWISNVRGIGPVLGTKVLGLIEDISRFDTVSKLWRFAGYAVIDGQAEKRKKGEKSHYNCRLKTALYLVGESFIKSNSPYREVYDKAKEQYEREHPDWTPRHRHLAAQRKMVKLFLAHLWEVWRRAEGLPVRPPYVLEHGHTTYIDPWAYSTAQPV